MVALGPLAIATIVCAALCVVVIIASSVLLAEACNRKWLTSGTKILSLYQITKDVGTLLRQAGVPYVADSGTLLGAVRHGGIIPIDDDVDLAVMAEDEPALLAAKPLLRAHGYDLVPFVFGYKICKRNLTRMPFVDIFIMRHDPVAGRTFYRNSSDQGYYTTEELAQGVTEYPFGELRMPGMRAAAPYLNRAYGNDWNDVWYRTVQHTGWFGVLPLRKVKRALQPEDRQPAKPTGPLH